MISPTTLASRLAEYLPRQRWFGAKDRTIELVRVVETETLRPSNPEDPAWPALLRVEAEVSLEGAPDGEESRYQLMIGLRPTGEACEFLTGREQSVLGEFETERGHALAYDAVFDSELALALLRRVAPDQAAERVRPVGTEQSNTSLVYDDAVILKLFRRLADGPNPDVEVTQALFKVGFDHVAEPLASWREGDRDLVFLQRFLSGAMEGWAMALTSLRELYAEPMVPAESGGDFGAETHRLGEITAKLHIAMGEAFGISSGEPAQWAELMEAQARRVLSGELEREALSVIRRLREVVDPGPAIRVHGDYHLGQVMRTDNGWFILDFEGEPARPLAERSRPTSPLKDVAGMLRSFQYAPAVAMATQEEDMTGLARAWEARNRECFLAGYMGLAEEAGLVPADPVARQAVLAAFELDKAIYELAYEQAHRPDWVKIPTEAVRRLTGVNSS